MSAAGVGVYLQALPVDLAVQLAARAERSGFASVWFSEIRLATGIVENRHGRVYERPLAAMRECLTAISGSPAHARGRIAAHPDAGLRTVVVLNPSPPGGLFPLYERHFPANATLPEFSFDAYVDVVERTIATLGKTA